MVFAITTLFSPTVSKYISNKVSYLQSAVLSGMGILTSTGLFGAGYAIRNAIPNRGGGEDEEKY